MSPAMDKERLMQVLLAPQVSEKSTFVGEKNNQYVFRVAAAAEHAIGEPEQAPAMGRQRVAVTRPV